MKELLTLLIGIALQCGVNAQINCSLLINKNNETVCPGETFTIQANALAAGFGPDMTCPHASGFAWYPFCGNANNETGMGFNGRVNGSKLTFNRYGRSNSAYLFDGTNDYVSMPGLPLSGSFKISTWINTSLKGSQAIITKGLKVPGYAGFQLSLLYDAGANSCFPAFYVQGKTNVPWGVTATQDVADGEWHKITINYDQGYYQKRSYIYIYIDGVQAANIEGYFPPIETENNYPLLVGAQYDNNYLPSEFFQGSIDDIAVNSTEEDLTPNYTYQWSTGATTASIDFSTIVNTVYIVTVTGNNGTCSDTLMVAVNQDLLPETPDTIFGTSIQCIPTTAGTVKYFVSPQPGIQLYEWSLPAGMKIDNGPGTSTINVSWTSMAVQNGISGDMCVIAKNICGQSIPYCKKVDMEYVQPKMPVSIVSGNGYKICPGDGFLELTTSYVKRAVFYNWTVAPGLSIISGQGTRVLTVKAETGFVKGKVSVIALNVCGSSPVQSRMIYNDFPMIPSISGPLSDFCDFINGNAFYNISNKSNFSLATRFEWSGFKDDYFQLPDASIVTSMLNIVSPFTITLKAENGCGVKTRAVIANPSPPKPSLIAGTVNICPGATAITYSIADGHSGSAPTYEWQVLGNANIIAGQGTKAILVDFPLSSTGNVSIKVREINTCNLTSPWRIMMLNVSTNNCRLLCVNEKGENQMNVYPNPAVDYIHINLKCASDQQATIRLYDIYGKIILNLNKEVTSGNNSINLPLDNIISGIYYIEVSGGLIRRQQKIQIVN